MPNFLPENRKPVHHNLSPELPVQAETMPATPRIAVAPETSEQMESARLLATRLDLDLAGIGETGYPLVLVVTDRRLELRWTAPHSPGPVFVDFLAGKADYRRRYGSKRDEAVVRAVASKRNRAPTVLDATGGLGRDAFVLAGHGCKVTVVERNPVIAALLVNGLTRAAADEKLGVLVKERMKLAIGDSREIMRNMPAGKRPEVVYLDPMYPESVKSAKVKKEAQALRMLAGPDMDSVDLLAAALACALQRVVVKRPATAPPLAGLKPDLVNAAGSHRFDIYLTEI
jgi:16S rRNA (guanine1516-N2)-methyltransferase